MEGLLDELDLMRTELTDALHSSREATHRAEAAEQQVGEAASLYNLRCLGFLFDRVPIIK